jgi:hypothetical protein
MVGLSSRVELIPREITTVEYRSRPAIAEISPRPSPVFILKKAVFTPARLLPTTWRLPCAGDAK